MLTAACLAAFLLAVPVAWLLARWGAERAARWCRPSPMSARLTNRQFDGWSRRIGWPAVLGYAGIDLIASRGFTLAVTSVRGARQGPGPGWSQSLSTAELATKNRGAPFPAAVLLPHGVAREMGGAG